MTPEAEARYALDYNINRRDLKSAEARAAYDRLLAEREGRPVSALPTLSDAETRAGIIEMFKMHNDKFRLPFEDGRLALASFTGGNWQEYGAIVIQMAILDTLLNIEKMLGQSQPGG